MAALLASIAVSAAAAVIGHFQYPESRSESSIVNIVIFSCIAGGFYVAAIIVQQWHLIRSQLLQEQENTAEEHSKRVVVEEKTRIARELHDDLGATLTSISLAAGLLKKKFPHTGDREVSIIATASATMVDQMNEIVWSLNNNNDQVESLVAYIRRFAANFLGEAGIGLEVIADKIPENTPLPGYVRRSLYLAVKEALHNVVKHAHATQVWLSLQETAQAVCLSVRDDGRGFDPEAQGRGTLGQRSMRERAAGIGADLQVSSAPGQGTQVTLTLHRAAQTMPTPAEASEVSA